MFAPLVKGFIDGLKKQSGGKPGTQKESGIVSQV